MGSQLKIVSLSWINFMIAKKNRIYKYVPNGATFTIFQEHVFKYRRVSVMKYIPAFSLDEKAFIR